MLLSLIVCLILKFTSSQNGPARIVKQFHYMNWYDHDIPEDASAQIEIINFLERVRLAQAPEPTNTKLVESQPPILGESHE
jgi:protein tyrosine phosphatase